MIDSLSYLFFYLTASFLLGYVILKILSESRKVLCTCTSKLDGKTVVITGGNTGIGLETAKILARRGARVVIASRNVAKSQAAVEAIIAASGNSKVKCKPLDLSSLASVKRFADDFNANHDRLDILINNAGFAEFERNKSADGIDRVMQVNHVAPVYLTNLLLDKLVSSKPSRIIFVSSEGHKFVKKFDTEDLEHNKTKGVWMRYCNTKLCNVLSVKALAKRVPDGVSVYAVHPGTSLTEIFDFFPWPLMIVSRFLVAPFLKTAAECAQTSSHVATSPLLANVSTGYFKNCKKILPSQVATDELAETVWEKTMTLIENKTKHLN